MTPTARIASVSLFALISITSVVSIAAAETRPTPDPQLCAEYLRDLSTYRRMAELLGCQIPDEASASTGASAQTASTEVQDTQFPPVVVDDAPSATAFPPVVTDQASTQQADSGFPPVIGASNEQQKTDFPPVVSSEGSRSGKTSRHTSSNSASFPPVVASADPEPESSFDEPADQVRAAIEEKIEIFKEEARARVSDAIAEKADEVKDRIKEKIKHKIGDALNHHHHEDGTQTLRHAAKNAVKRMLSEHRHGEGLLGKLAGLRRR